MLRSVSIPSALSRRSGPLAASLLLLLALGAGPASAESGTISGPRTGPIYVFDGDTLNIVDGAQISSSDAGVNVHGGTVNISGGSISGSTDAVTASGGTVNISGGSISGQDGVHVNGGTVNISGGLISGNPFGVVYLSGAVSISGCGLALSRQQLTGTLAGGQSIDTLIFGLTAANLQNLSTCDTTPPITTAAATAGGNPYTAGTWTNQAVNIVLNAVDLGGSGTKEIVYSATGAQPISATTVLGSMASFLISAEGTTTVSFHAEDNAGNIEQPAQTFVVKSDQTAPVVSYSGNAGSYTVDQTVNISCSCADPMLADGEAGSGVASSTCQNITGPAYTFALGLNAFSATATDNAGNTGRGATSFTVQDTPGSLGRLVAQFVTDPAVAQGLQDKLTAIAQGNGTAKAGAVGAFINQVNAQTGKSIPAAQAAILIRLVHAL